MVISGFNILVSTGSDAGQLFDVQRPHVLSSSNCYLRALCYIYPLVSKDATNTITCSVVGSKLDYSNAILYGITESKLNQLQRDQNSS